MTKPSAKAREIAEAILRAVPGMTPEAVESSASLPAMAALIDAHLGDVREAMKRVLDASPDIPDERATATEILLWRKMWIEFQAALATLTPEKDDE